MQFRISWLSVVAAGLLFLTGAHAAADSGVQRMYVFHCGEAVTNDISFWSPGVDVGKAGEFSHNCYLIRHARGLMMWDTGVSDRVAEMPDGLVVGRTGFIAGCPAQTSTANKASLRWPRSRQLSRPNTPSYGLRARSEIT